MLTDMLLRFNRVLAGDVAEFADVSIAGLLGELHVVGVDKFGRLWHTIRHDDGSWDKKTDTDNSDM